MSAPTRRRRARPALLAPMLVLMLALTACVSMPESGPVRDAPVGAGLDEGLGSYYDPSGPQPGASAHDIVLGFLDAMQAAPMRTDVARQFLSRDAQPVWNPQRETIVYSNRPTPEGSALVTISLDGTYLDRRGAWQGSLPQGSEEVGFAMVKEEGEWRIDRAPNALIVPDYWFDEWFVQHSTYFFDPTGRFLVPQPVYVPKGDQLPTALLDSLLRGAGSGLTGVVRSFLPADLKLDLSVPVSDDGVAEINFRGDPGQVTTHSQELLLAQLAWTLRSDPEISSFRVAIDDVDLAGPDGRTEFSIAQGAQYDPTGVAATSLLFGLGDGVVVSGSPAALAPVDGVAGREPQGWSTIAVNVSGTRVAGVSPLGDQVSVGPVQPAAAADLGSVLSGLADPLRPAWDLSGRLWVLDRPRGRARLTVVDGSRRSTVLVRGVTGRDVRRLLVSRDGSRLVAVVAGRAGDRVVVSRLRYDERGHVRGATRATALAWDPATATRVVDIGWHSASSVSVLYPLTADYSQVATFSVDGSPGAEGSLTSTVRGRVTRLVSSPVTGDPVYIVLRRGIAPLGDAGLVERIPGLDASTLTYAG